MIDKVVFIAAAARPDAGSTVLRSVQLRSLVAPALSDIGVPATFATYTGFCNAILVLNKSALMSLDAGAIETMRRGGNRIYADPLDAQIADETLVASDVLIAASMAQFAHFTERFPGHRVAYVGHHVDLRIGDVRPPMDRLRIGYFGEVTNARFAAQIADLVALYRVNTSRASKHGWMRRLRDYNAHYAVRARRDFDGFKPFTKGFVAAHCGAVVLVGADDTEAMHFLPGDYPYFVAGDGVGEVRTMIERMRADFGGQVWRRAQDAMAEVRLRSSREQTAEQLLAVLAADLTTTGSRRSALRFRPPPNMGEWGRPSLGGSILRRLGWRN
jgi:hypothetical protein